MTALVVLPGVPVAAVGTWQASTGEWRCTREQLADAVRAQADPAFRVPVVHLGHDDPRYDGEPAVGRLENLRLADEGDTLVADLVGVPAWLAEVMASAYPSRSIEALLGVTMADGTEYAMVVTGLALLGVTAPAIESLADIADLYGASRDVTTYAAASTVAASALPAERTTPMPRALGQVVASASIDELTSAAEQWAADQAQLGRSAWVRDIYTDTVVWCAWPDDVMQFWRAPWTETADGVFTFGALDRVRPTYEPIPQEATSVPVAASAARWLASHTGRSVPARETQTPVLSARGRAVTAGDKPTEEHVTSPAVAAALGLPEDADDDTVLAAVEALRTQAPTPTDQNEEGGTVNEPAPVQPTGQAPDVEQLVAAAVQRATEPILASLKTTSQELADIKAEKSKTVKDGVIGDAVKAGKIKPADRASWEARYDKAPDVITEVLAATAPGAAVPVSASGHTGGEVTGGDEPFSDAEYARIFGDAEKAGL